jgi:hypothetical protein
MVNKIAKDVGAKEATINAICETKNIKLSEQSQAYKQELYDYARIVRHQLIHNNNGTPKNEDKFKKLCHNNSGFDYVEGRLSINDDKYIRKTLEQEYIVLSELAEKLGYKTEIISISKES